MKHILLFVVLLLLPLYLFTQNDDKKIEFEVSVGISTLSSGPSLYYRSSGMDELIDHYSRYYQASSTVSGEFGEIKTQLPINFSVNYNFADSWYAKVGLEYSRGSASSEKEYGISWDEMNEKYLNNFNYKISSFMPFIGIEKRFSSFSLYANAGFGFIRFSHTEDLEYSENSLSYELHSTFSTKGSGIGIILGGKYFLTVLKNKKLLIKLEYIYLKTGSLKGEKQIVGTNADGGSISEKTDGTLFVHETNPFGLGWFDFWDLFESSPDDTWIRDIKKMSLKISGIRLMIGIAF